jgi:hypothetical protein
MYLEDKMECMYLDAQTARHVGKALRDIDQGRGDQYR